MVEHLADCRDCYEVFSQTIGTVKAISARKKKRFVWLGAPALALAASLIIFVMMTPFGPRTDLPSSHEMLCGLTEVVEISQLVKTSFDEQPSRVYGFASSLSPQKRAFGLGFYMAGLELALSGNYPEHALQYLSLLKKNAGKESWDSYLRLLLEDEDIKYTAHAMEIVRKKELQADSYGIIYASMAGYDPAVIVDTKGKNFFKEWVSQDAIRDFKIACEKDTSYIPARVNLSSAMIMAGNYSGAMAVLDEALKLKKDDAGALSKQGCCHVFTRPLHQGGHVCSGNRCSERGGQKEQ